MALMESLPSWSSSKSLSTTHQEYCLSQKKSTTAALPNMTSFSLFRNPIFSYLFYVNGDSRNCLCLVDIMAKKGPQTHYKAKHQKKERLVKYISKRLLHPIIILHVFILCPLFLKYQFSRSLEKVSSRGKKYPLRKV